jgi:ketosteroid isomerase-like protein
MSESTQELIDGYYAAMRRGPEAEADMIALLADDIVYIEPFTSPGEPAVGIEAVRARLRSGWETPLPEMELDVIAVDIRGDTATTRWECRSPALPTPARGTDTYTFAGGKITRLVVEVDDARA